MHLSGRASMMNPWFPSFRFKLISLGFHSLLLLLPLEFFEASPRLSHCICRSLSIYHRSQTIDVPLTSLIFFSLYLIKSIIKYKLKNESFPPYLNCPNTAAQYSVGSPSRCRVLLPSTPSHIAQLARRFKIQSTVFYWMPFTSASM